MNVSTSVSASTSTSPAVSVRVLWASRHTFAAGQEARHRDIPVYALWLMLDGSLEAEIDGASWRVEAGQVFLAPPLAARRIYAPHGAQWLTLGLQATAFHRIDVLRALALPQIKRPQEPERALLESWMRHLAQAWPRVETAFSSSVRADSRLRRADSSAVKSGVSRFDSKPPVSSAAALMCQGLGHAVFGLCWHLWGDWDLARVLRGEAPAWIARTLERIEAQPSVSVDELARAAGFSAAQFRRGFNRWTGFSPRDYLIQNRLEAARRLLRNSRLPIRHVAREAGFADASHFTRLFAKAFALTPSAYRRLDEESPL